MQALGDRYSVHRTYRLEPVWEKERISITFKVIIRVMISVTDWCERCGSAKKIEFYLASEVFDLHATFNLLNIVCSTCHLLSRSRQNLEQRN